MKNCVNCNIYVGGDMDACPLCQNSLVGEASHNNWPPIEKLKKKALAYKIHLFIVLAMAAISLGLDFMFELNDGKHWSLVVALTVIIVETVLRGFIKKNFVLAKIISISALHIMIIVIFTSWYYGFMDIIIYLVLPIVFSFTIVFNFILSLVDTSGNAMIYLLANIVVNAAPYAYFIVRHYTRTLAWNICMLLSVIAIIGIIVFKGRQVIKEVEKRMYF